MLDRLRSRQGMHHRQVRVRGRGQLVQQPLRPDQRQLRATGGLRCLHEQRSLRKQRVRLRPRSGRHHVWSEAVRDRGEQLRSDRGLREQRRLRHAWSDLQGGWLVLQRQRRGLLDAVRKRHRDEQLRAGRRLRGGLRGRSGLYRHRLLHPGAARGDVCGHRVWSSNEQLRAGRHVPGHLRCTEHVRRRRERAQRLRLHLDGQSLRQPLQRNDDRQLRDGLHLHQVMWPRRRVSLRRWDVLGRWHLRVPSSALSLISRGDPAASTRGRGTMFRRAAP
jgi:hypothetical protein